MIGVIRVFTVITTLWAALPTSTSMPHAPTPTPPAPLFGTNPELFLSPTFGTPGARIRIVGLGFRPHTAVYIVFLQSEKSGFSLKEIQRAVKVHTRAAPSGVVRATYTVGTDMNPANASAVIYFAFATYDGNPHSLLAHKLAGTAFVVCALCVSR